MIVNRFSVESKVNNLFSLKKPSRPKVTNLGEGSRAGHARSRGGGVKKWPKKGHVVYERPLTYHLQ